MRQQPARRRKQFWVNLWSWAIFSHVTPSIQNQSWESVNHLRTPGALVVVFHSKGTSQFVGHLCRNSSCVSVPTLSELRLEFRTAKVAQVGLQMVGPILEVKANFSFLAIQPALLFVYHSLPLRTRIIGSSSLKRLSQITEFDNDNVHIECKKNHSGVGVLVFSVLLTNYLKAIPPTFTL